MRFFFKENIIQFLKNPDNKIDPHDVCFLHGKASWFKKNATREFLKNSGSDSFSNSQYHGVSHILNISEYFGVVLKYYVESPIIGELDRRNTLFYRFTATLLDMAEDTSLFLAYITFLTENIGSRKSNEWRV